MKKYIPIVFSFLLLMLGCDTTVYRLLYDSLDAMIYRSVTRYITPSPGQDRFLKENIDMHLRWHRKVELPKYIATLQGLRERMAAGLKKPDIAWMQDRFERHEADLYNEISDDVVGFLVSLDQKQVDQLEKTMGERISEFEKEMRKSPEDRINETTRSFTRLAEFIYGDLSDPQKKDIAQMVRRKEDLEPLRIRLYRDRQAEFIALLRNRPGRDRVRAYIARLFIDPEKSYPDYFRMPAARHDRNIVESFLRFDRELVTPAQRSHACKKIDNLIQAFRELNAESPAADGQ
jgi:hypothetical protein